MLHTHVFNGRFESNFLKGTNDLHTHRTCTPEIPWLESCRVHCLNCPGYPGVRGLLRDLAVAYLSKSTLGSDMVASSVAQCIIYEAQSPITLI